MLHPLLCKALVNAEAPLQWKGSQLAALFKGKGARTSIKSYRDVSLCDPDAKMYGKILRRFLSKAVGAMSPTMQFGSGLGGGGCDLPHLAARAVLQLAETSSCCVALLFLDATTAFASMVRETLFPTVAGRQAWMHFLVTRGYPPDFASEVVEAVASVCDWESTGLSAHALAVLTDFHTNTWFSMELLPGVCSSARGCAAGNPVADLVFIASDIILAQRLHLSLQQHGLTHTLNDYDARAFFGLDGIPIDHQLSRVAYVDDGVIPVVGPACGIVERLRSAASVAQSVYETHGLALNFAAGKSEAVMAFHGPGAQIARNHVFSDCGGFLACDRFDNSTFELRIVGRYRHLGGVITGTGDLYPEIGPKMAQVRQIARQLRRPFLRDPAIPIKKKGQVIQALVLARGMHLAGCWPLLLSREARLLKRALVDTCRPLLGEQPTLKRSADDDILSRLGVLLPLRLLSLMRVQTAIRVAVRAPLQVLLLLYAARESTRSWLRALEHDLLHLSQATCLSELRGASISKWFAFFRANPVVARSVIVKAAVTTNWVTQIEREQELVMTTYCLLCGEPCRDKQALSIHMFRGHGARRYIRSFVHGSDFHDCLVCGLRLASRQRLVGHLAEKGPLCAHNYVLRYEPMSAEQTSELDVASRSDFSRRRRLEGAHGIRYYGPYLPVVDLAGVEIRSRHPLGPNRRWAG